MLEAGRVTAVLNKNINIHKMTLKFFINHFQFGVLILTYDDLEKMRELEVRYVLFIFNTHLILGKSSTTIAQIIYAMCTHVVAELQ